MDENRFETGAAAAGALAFLIDLERGHLALSGQVARFGLSGSDWKLTDFYGRIGPFDRDALRASLERDAIDLRIRIIGEDGQLSYARLLGQREGNQFRGLMTPAGQTSQSAVRIADEHALADAVQSGEVCAYYQPVISLADRCLAGFEALARWQRPGVGVLAPADFLGMAEDLDLLSAISTLVRDHAIADLSSWRRAIPEAKALFVAANASVSELVSPDFQERLIERVHAADLPANSFKLEVAETEIMRDPDAAESAMQRLAEAGVALALDDFGTGYSSLARLESLPFHVVKIDQYFVRAMAGNDSASTVVESVIQLARHFRMKVVAEGVETEAAAQALAAMGCDYAQGYRFAGALPPEDAVIAIQSGLDGRFGPPR